jgi:polysaccharide biosynthesis/export protein
MKKAAFALALIAFAFYAASAQEATGREAAEPAGVADIDAPTRLNLAVSSLDYPVTPGDVYRLDYRQAGGALVAVEARCDGLYMVDLGIFGKIDAASMTYLQLKKKIEEQIIKNYSYSTPAFTMTDPGVFRVCLRDGASRIRYRMAWGLSRLSEMVADLDLSSFSLRNVELISVNGKSKSYDLLMAALTKSDAIDPLVRPSDTVMLHVPAKTVRLEGEVFRPGLYEIKEGEGIKELIELFGGGLSNRGDPSRVRIDRRAADVERSDYVSLPGAYDKKIALGDGDLVLVRSRDERLPLIWVEGAVSSGALERALDSGAGTAGGPGDAAAQAAPPAAQEADTGRFSYPIREGQLLSDVLQDVKRAILPSADLRSASIFMPDSLTSKPVNAQALLTGADMSTDIALSSGYRLMIPSVRTDVMVTGAVASPGSFPYRSGAEAKYYISLAGGADSERNSFGAFYLYDSEGKRKKAAAGIQPGDRIHLRSNSFLYAMERGTPLISSILGLAISAYGVYVIVQQNVQR